jgi:hypothetical protein
MKHRQLHRLLEGLPGVVRVEMPVAPARPSARIVHIRDHHFVFPALVRPEFARAQLDLLPTVQNEQGRVLEALMGYCDVREVFIEGVTEDRIVDWKKDARKLTHDYHRVNAAALLGPYHIPIPAVIWALQDALDQEATPGRGKGVLGKDRRDWLTKVEAALDRGSAFRVAEVCKRLARGPAVSKAERRRLLDDLAFLQGQWLQLGAAGRGFMAGYLEDVLTLEDADALLDAFPYTYDGKYCLDPLANKAREEAMVRAMLRHPPLAVCVLGASHDLSGSVREWGRGRVAYTRVTTAMVARLVDGKFRRGAPA